MPSGYAMTQLKGWSMTSDVDTFRQGAAYRNGKDWAKQQRDEAIAQANKITLLPAAIQSLHTSAPSEDASETTTSRTTTNDISLNSHQTTDMSEIELSLDFIHPPKRSRSLKKKKHDPTMNLHGQDPSGKRLSHEVNLGVISEGKGAVRGRKPNTKDTS
ncbi:hypothetical protein V2G26_019461 [Clonostachys chloroleuca]